MNCSPPGSSVHGILQVRILEWAAMSSSRRPSRLRDPTCISPVSCSGRQVLYHGCHPGSPWCYTVGATSPAGFALMGELAASKAVSGQTLVAVKYDWGWWGPNTLRTLSKHEDETRQLEKPPLLLERSKTVPLLLASSLFRAPGVKQQVIETLIVEKRVLSMENCAHTWAIISSSRNIPALCSDAHSDSAEEPRPLLETF